MPDLRRMARDLVDETSFRITVILSIHFERLVRLRVHCCRSAEIPFPVAPEAIMHRNLEGTFAMNSEFSRRQFIKGAGSGVATTAIGAFGFDDVERAYAAAIRPFKLLGTKETRSTCTYCSVACGIVIYAKGDLSKGERAEITHIEGDVDHPTNRGTLCPKGAALLDMVHSKSRTLYPQIRKPGSDQFERVSWDVALDRVARLMKDDRDKNFITKNSNGETVNRWLTTGFLAASATTNETALLTYKVVRSAGILAFDNQARV